MEYCGAGSVLDIMKLRGIHHGLPKGVVKSLTEEEIATVLSDTLKGIDTVFMIYFVIM
jgi:serine/threonine kinase 3